VFTQDNRVIKIETPLGKDVLLLESLSGQEAISSLFQFHLDLLAENQQAVVFDKLLGQKVTIEIMLPDDKQTFFSGIVSSFSQGSRGQRFTRYRAEMVPQFWLLTRNVRSRIFQSKTAIDILREVLTGLDVAFEIQGTFESRDYCTQYRESDFQFASRLMEEEGIYYFFKHSENSHTMVLANTTQSHPDLVPESHIIYEELTGGTREEERIHQWEKLQELRSGKYTLWDNCFELPKKHLEAEKTILETVQAGKVVHKLKAGGNDQLEIYDYPGAYAQRFDGVDPGGAERSDDVTKIFQDNTRTVGIRMQQEALPSLIINGSSNCRQLVSGFKFTLTRHFNGDGQYVLTSISHAAKHEIDSQGGTVGDGHYSNEFTCIPFALPFRPARSTARPFVRGSQTATVVGPAGEEIFTDKYSRVKVQFHWDRQGKNDANSSCWVRVGTVWAGKQWGAIHIPRIDQEVIVDFLEGDPDQPIIVGSVYNADQMPPYTLPDNKTQSGLKSRSTLNGGTEDFNELRFEDKKDSEDIYFHAQKDFHRVVEHDDDLKVGHDQTIEIKNDRTETVKEGNEKVTIEKGNRSIFVDTGNDLHQIKQGNRDVKIDMGNDTLKISMGNQQTNIDLGKSETEAMQSIELKVGQSSVKLDQMGVTIKGMMITIEGQIQVQVKGLMTQIQGTAMLQEQGGIVMIN
jgi:type VI secretion system secreted protein VgrG